MNFYGCEYNSALKSTLCFSEGVQLLHFIQWDVFNIMKFVKGLNTSINFYWNIKQLSGILVSRKI